MKRLLNFLLILLLPSLTHACLWLEGTTIDGEHKTFEDKTISSLFLKSSQHASPQKNFKQRFYREDNQTVEYLALQAIMQGDYDQGIEKLLQIEDENQNLYATASNLGTAYELKGDNVSAIKWIKEGINRDASSHYGTEWLHLLILETKLQLENNSTLLKNSHIISLPNHFNDTTTIKIKDKNYTIKEVRNTLLYQLQERLIFVKPKDKVVADLLYTFAKIEEQTTVLEEAEHLLKMAIEYGFDNQLDIQSIYCNLNESMSSLRRKVAFTGFLLFFGFITLIIFLGRLLRKWKKKKLQKKQLSPLSFALSINLYLLLFTMLSLPIYASIQKGTPNVLLFYLLLIPSYLLAIYFAVKDMQERYKIIDQKKSRLYSIVIYIGFIVFLYFKFLQNENSDIRAYFIVHTLLTIGILYFLRWRMKKYE